MKKQLTYIAPLRAGIVLCALYGLLSLIITPFILLAVVFGGKGGAGFVILLPLLYTGAGFLAGVIGAALYNLIAGWTGGFEIELGDLATAS
jgi:hypothetical protein